MTNRPQDCRVAVLRDRRVARCAVLAAIVSLLVAQLSCRKGLSPAEVYRGGTDDAGCLWVTSSPSGASILVDGALVGTSPLLVEGVSTGQRLVSLTLTGYVNWTTSVAVQAGAIDSLAAVLPAASAQVSSDPAGATVALDGNNTGQVTPCVLTDVPDGAHDISLSMPGRYTYDTAVVVATGQTATVSHEFLPRELNAYAISCPVRAVAVTDAWVYIVCDYGLHVVESGSPYYLQGRGCDHVGSWCLQAALLPTRVLLANWSQGVCVMDARDPDDPVKETHWGFGGNGYYYDVATVGDYVYIAGDSGVGIVNAHVLSSPRWVTSIKTHSSAQSVCARGSLVCVADFTSGLSVYDVSDTSSPGEVGCVATPSAAYSVALADSVVALATYDSAYIFIVSLPATLRRLGAVGVPGGPRCVALDEKRMYVGTSDGLRVYDVSDPARPSEIGCVVTGQTVWHVTLHDQFAYLANDSAGLRIVRVK